MHNLLIFIFSPERHILVDVLHFIALRSPSLHKCDATKYCATSCARAKFCERRSAVFAVGGDCSCARIVQDALPIKDELMTGYDE